MTSPQHDSNQQPLGIIAPENVWQMNRSVPCFPPPCPCFPPLARMWHRSVDRSTPGLPVFVREQHGSIGYYTVVSHRWTDCPDLNLTVVCPSPSCISLNSVLRRQWAHQRVGMCETDGLLSLKRGSSSGLWKSRRRKKKKKKPQQNVAERVSPQLRE